MGKINSKFSHIVILVVLIFALAGCASNADLEIVATPVSEPSRLPDTLAHQKILFNTREGLTHITSLDRQEVASLKTVGNDPAISPDGKYLAYTTWEQVRIVNLKTGEDQVVIDADTLGVRAIYT